MAPFVTLIALFSVLLDVCRSVAAVGTVSGNASSPVIDLGYAQYQGAYNATSNITSFLSIRYAAPPVGGS